MLYRHNHLFALSFSSLHRGERNRWRYSGTPNRLGTAFGIAPCCVVCVFLCGFSFSCTPIVTIRSLDRALATWPSQPYLLCKKIVSKYIIGRAKVSHLTWENKRENLEILHLLWRQIPLQISWFKESAQYAPAPSRSPCYSVIWRPWG